MCMLGVARELTLLKAQLPLLIMCVVALGAVQTGIAVIAKAGA